MRRLAVLILLLLATGPVWAQRIDSVVHTGRNVLKAGDVLHVVALGSGGGQARFEILGAIRAVNMVETSFGRYEADYKVPRGLTVKDGVLLVTLRYAGREAAREADRLVSIGGGNPSTAPAASAWRAWPGPDVTHQGKRPVIKVRFPKRVTERTSVNFYVDGIDFSTQTVTPNRWQISKEAEEIGEKYPDRYQYLLWEPRYDLAAGSHTVHVDAVAENGERLEWDYTFKTGQAAGVQVTTMPEEGSTIKEDQPRIGVRFPGTEDQRNRIDYQRLQLKMDGRNLSGNVNVSQNEIYFRPSTRLTPGAHQVDLLAYDVNGQKLVDRSWRFTVEDPNNPQSAQLTATNIHNGDTLGQTFNVEGTAPPGSRVRVLVEHPKKDILSQIAGVMLRFESEGVAGSDGRFSIPLNAGAVPVGDPMRITLTDSSNSSPVVIQTRRGNTGGNTSNPGQNTGANSGPVNFSPYPGSGATVGDARPRIGASFGRNVDRARLVIDGRDFTPRARFEKNQIYWDPSYDLDRSQHQVQVTTWVNGQQRQTSWSFEIK